MKIGDLLAMSATQVKTRREIAELILAQGEDADSAEAWAEEWLASPRFVLASVQGGRVAAPRTKIRSALVIIDANKKNTGGTNRGFLPQEIVVAGREIYTGASKAGHENIMAWVGTKCKQDVSRLPNLRRQGRSMKLEDAVKLQIMAGAGATSQTGGSGAPMGNLNESLIPKTALTGAKNKKKVKGAGNEMMEFHKGKSMKGGGPGSGRHPGFGTKVAPSRAGRRGQRPNFAGLGSQGTDTLNRMHEGLKDKGFSWHHSSGNDKGTVTHTYFKGTGPGSTGGGGERASIVQRANGDHYVK